MTGAKISVIVPIYNGEKFIRKTILRVLGQNYSNIEVLLIDDGSTDNSFKICQSFMVDKRVHVYRHENAGISYTRNKGISLATGDFISFIDQDDEIDENIYEVLTRGIIDDNVDCIISGKVMKLVDENNQIISKKRYTYSNQYICTKEEKFKMIFNFNNDTSSFHLWNCLYRRELLNREKIQFSEKLKFGHEDTLFNVEVLSKSSAIVKVPGVVYNYYQRKNHSTSLKNNDMYLKDFFLFSEKFTKVVKLYDDGEEFIFQYLLRLGLSLYSQYGLDSNDLEAIYKICINSSKNRKRVFKGSFILKIYCNFFDFLLKNRYYRFSSHILKIIKGR